MRDRQADGNSHCRCEGVVVEPYGSDKEAGSETVNLLYIPTLTIWPYSETSGIQVGKMYFFSKCHVMPLSMWEHLS